MSVPGATLKQLQKMKKLELRELAEVHLYVVELRKEPEYYDCYQLVEELDEDIHSMTRLELIDALNQHDCYLDELNEEEDDEDEESCSNYELGLCRHGSRRDDGCDHLDCHGGFGGDDDCHEDD